MFEWLKFWKAKPKKKYDKIESVILVGQQRYSNITQGTNNVTVGNPYLSAAEYSHINKSTLKTAKEKPAVNRDSMVSKRKVVSEPKHDNSNDLLLGAALGYAVASSTRHNESTPESSYTRSSGDYSGGGSTVSLDDTKSYSSDSSSSSSSDSSSSSSSDSSSSSSDSSSSSSE